MMKLYRIVFLLTFIGCKDAQELNDKLYQSQIAHIKQSPYDEAKGMMGRLESQRQFRLKVLPDLINYKLSDLDTKQDTIFLSEEFSEECINCWSSRMHILKGDKIISIKTLWDRQKTNYKVDSVRLDLDSVDWNYQLEYGTLLEIKREDLKGNDWTNNTLEKGAISCFDGDHTIVTVIYPNGETKSIYARCWIPEIQRTIKKN